MVMEMCNVYKNLGCEKVKLDESSTRGFDDDYSNVQLLWSIFFGVGGGGVTLVYNYRKLSVSSIQTLLLIFDLRHPPRLVCFHTLCIIIESLASLQTLLISIVLLAPYASISLVYYYRKLSLLQTLLLISVFLILARYVSTSLVVKVSPIFFHSMYFLSLFAMDSEIQSQFLLFPQFLNLSLCL